VVEAVVEKIEVIPGILEKDFNIIKQRVDLVKDYVEWVEIDILDNTLYPNDTYNNWEAFKLFPPKIKRAAHLMVSDPYKYVESLIKNGFTRLIADVAGETVRDFIEATKAHKIEVGVALDGPSPLELVEPYLGEVDTVLLMTIKSGFSGTSFLKEALPKIRKVHEEYQNLPIEVDGGIDKNTAPLVIQNGATRLVSTSYLFWKNPHRIKEAIEELKNS